MQSDNPIFWNQLYSNPHYMFGENPNEYLVDKLATLPAGKILLPGDGEGRNAVYCAQQDWETHAFDISEIGKIKADALAQKNQVSIHFEVSNVPELNYPSQSFDAIALIFCHFTPETRRDYHQKLLTYLKPGGFVILEGFSRSDSELMDIRFNLNELKKDFESLEMIESNDFYHLLHEGMVIQGEQKVIQLFARKPF